MDFMKMLSGGAMGDMFKQPMEDMVKMLSSIDAHMRANAESLARIEAHLGTDKPQIAEVENDGHSGKD